MNISIPEVINIVTWIFSTIVALLFGLSLVGAKVKAIIEPVSIAGVILWIFYYLFCLIFDSSYCVLLSFLLAIPILKKMLNRTYPFISIAVLVALILKCVIQILVNQLLPCFYTYGDSSKISIFANAALLSIYSIMGCIIFIRSISIFPDNWERYSIEDNDQKKKYRRNILLIILVLVSITLWIIYIDENINKFMVKQQIYILSFTMVFIIIFIYFIKILVSYNIERVETLIDKQYQKEVQAFMEIIRSQRHDFNFHLQAISGMLENNNYSECKEYVSTMVKDARSMNDVLVVYHPAVGAMLNAFRELAAREGIQLEILIYYNLEHIPCTVYEINKILGNLIQNAIDEVGQHTEDSPWIQVMILKRSGNSVFRVTNRVFGDKSKLKKIFNSGYSTKSSHEGIGLNTVQKFAAKYNGIVYTEFEEDIIHFIVQIPNKY